MARTIEAFTTAELTSAPAWIKTIENAVTLPDEVEKKAKNIKEGSKLRAFVAENAIPAAKDDAQIVRAVVTGLGGAGFVKQDPNLPLAILHEVYRREGADALAYDEPLDEKIIRSVTEKIYADVEPQLYKFRVNAIIDKTGATISKVDKDAAAMLLIERRVPPNSPRFEREVFSALQTVKRDEEFDKFFETPPGKSVSSDLGPALTAERRRRAINVLEQLGVDPDNVKDEHEEWGRLAVGIAGADGRRRDIALAAYSPDAGIAFDGELDFPDFETADVIGLIPENIRTCADLYYIHMFDRLGVYRVVDAISVRFFDRLNLGLGDTARKLYVYIKRRGDRIPAEDRRRITDRIFEGDNDGRAPFKLLMGQMVEALIEYGRVRNAGDLLLNADRMTYNGSRGATRSGVNRSIENLQRYLSSAGGGMSVFLSREAGAQLIDAFDILQSPELQSYFGGEYGSGMWSIIEEVGAELEGGPLPPADRMRTLAVHGRKVMQWLADHPNDVSSIPDAEIDELSDRVQNWLAAYRKPAIEEPEWLDDDEMYDEEEDEGPAAEAIEDAMAEAREPDVLEVG